VHPSQLRRFLVAELVARGLPSFVATGGVSNVPRIIRLQLPASEFSQFERAEHQFQDRPLAEGIRDDFEVAIRTRPSARCYPAEGLLKLSTLSHKRDDAASNTDNVRKDAEKIVLTTMSSTFFIVVKTFKFDVAVFRTVLCNLD
jgi:hypothetical protein